MPTLRPAYRPAPTLDKPAEVVNRLGLMSSLHSQYHSYVRRLLSGSQIASGLLRSLGLNRPGSQDCATVPVLLREERLMSRRQYRYCVGVLSYNSLHCVTNALQTTNLSKKKRRAKHHSLGGGQSLLKARPD